MFTAALSDRSGTVATVIFGGNRSDRRNHSLSVASLYTLQLQTDPNSPIQTCERRGEGVGEGCPSVMDVCITS